MSRELQASGSPIDTAEYYRNEDVGGDAVRGMREGNCQASGWRLSEEYVDSSNGPELKHPVKRTGPR